MKVLLNDGTGAKMSYYLNADVSVQASRCGADGAVEEVTVSLSLASDAPSDVATFPRYLTGGGVYGVDPGIVRTLVSVYVPEGFEFIGGEGSFASGESIDVSLATDRGFVLARSSLDLGPGDSGNIELRYAVDGENVRNISPTVSPIVNRTVTVPLGIRCES